MMVDVKHFWIENLATHNNILNEQPEVIVPPGLRKIKQRELYNKWCMYLPEDKRAIVCPKPRCVIEEEDENAIAKEIKKAEKADAKALKDKKNKERMRKAIGN